MLKTLCDLNGTSGNEAAVRDYILEQIQPYCTTCTVDAMGSVIAFKKGKRTPEKRVMLSAHMDEVGFIITGATEAGLTLLWCWGAAWRWKTAASVWSARFPFTCFMRMQGRKCLPLMNY